MANEEKQVSVFVGRRITLERHGKAAVTLHAGHNTVDEDVAKHPFVKAHSIDGPATVQADAELQAQNAQLVKANTAGAAQLRDALNRAEAAEAKVAELQSMVDAFTATDTKAGKK